MDSILTSTKKLLGIEEDYTHFDDDIVMYVNAALMSLMQIGVGPKEGFAISDSTQTWQSFIGERSDLESVKAYVGLKVRLLFDPPQSGFLIEAIKSQISEFEWRLNVQAEST